jgi:hypothetical protein
MDSTNKEEGSALEHTLSAVHACFYTVVRISETVAFAKAARSSLQCMFPTISNSLRKAVTIRMIP